MDAPPLKIVLVEDHSLCRSGLTDLLQQRGRMQVAATGNPDVVPDLLRTLQPDLLVLDLRMPAMDGLTLLRRLRAAGFETPALILTMSDAQEDLAAALRAGVRGYLLKDMEPEDVIAAIARAARGESNKTIARALDISHDTVKLHVRHILAKLNLSSRVEAAVFAVEARAAASR